MSSVAHEGHQSEITIIFLTRADEDSILEEALIIEAKRKRIAELSAVTTSVESRCKSHWDFVLEEMAWLANDFVQERLWKITAAAQMSYHAAFTSQLRFQEINNSWSQKKIAHTLAKAVMNFWHSVKGINKMAELQCPKNGFGLTIHEYAIKFLKGNNFDILESQAEAPATPERVSDTAIVNLSWEDNLTEENLFYTVPPGAAETFRKSIESQVLQCEKTRTNMQEEVDASACEAMAGSQDYAYEEDEGEATMYDMPVAFGGSSSSRFSQKKRKFHMHTYNGRSYDVATDLSFTRCMENKVGSQQSMPQPKRLTTSLNESFPTKRVRTCYRERVLSPFSAGISGLQVSTKTDASSETSSFQDDQSNLHGGSHVPNCVEVESVGNFEKHREFNSVEVSMKFKKKKKSKYPGSSYEQRWSVDSNFQNEQGDYSRTRLESHQFESNDCNGIFGQHIPKKPKIMRPSRENTFDNNSLIHGLTPPPSASQMSNVPHTNKFTRMLTGRDLSRKAKSLKMPSGQPGSGSQWSPFEDQALVVLVHDMGPNWELVSDAINSTLQFKSIYRKPKECKERHKILMVTNGDGADSAEDSGSSQPYPSTLPGIPKGSARQLFQRLLGPVEEATLKSHIEKIILIGRKYLFGNTQGDNQDPKQIQQPHSSHTHALSQVIPNNLNGRILMPLDLCDAPSSSLDIPSVGYQTPHSSGLAVSNQASLGPISPSGANSATIQDSLNLSHGNNFSSSSSPLNASVRDIKYAISRATSMPVDEQQRMHHCNQQLPGRNISISSTPGAFPGPDRGGVRVLPSGNGMGIISGTNRGISTPRPGFQGIASPSSMLNSGSMTSSGMIAMPIPVNMHSGVSSGQGNSMATPRDNLHMMRPIQHQEAQRQMMLVERQIQASQVNSQAVPSFGGLTTSYPNQTASSHVPPYPPHHQQAQSPHIRSPLQSHAQATNHTTNSQQKTYALHLAKERQLQQRLLQQKQKFGTSNSVMPSVHQHQLPVSVSSPLHNSPQITSQSLSPPVLPSTSSVASMPQNQLKHSTLPHGHSQSSQSGGSCPTNQLSKQQPFQQTSRSHPQLRQQNAKLLKGLARGNALNQNMQMDPSALNRTSSNSRTIATEKGDQMTNSMQNQGLYSGSAINSLRPAKSSSARDMQQPQQKLHSDQAASSTKPLKQASQSDNMSKGHSLPTASMSTPTAGHQSIPTPVISSSNHQPVPHSQPQVHTQKILVNQSQSTKKTVQPGCLMNSEPSNKLQASESQFNQHIVNTSSPIGTMMATASECNTSTNAASVISPDVSQWKAAEPLFDSIGSLPNTAAGSEHSSEVGRGLSQRLSSDSLSPAGHDASLQLEQPSQLQTHSPVHQPQQHQQ